jgi:hypothetical protein
VGNDTSGSIKGWQFGDQLHENPLPRKDIVTVTSAEERLATRTVNTV